MGGANDREGPGHELEGFTVTQRSKEGDAECQPINPGHGAGASIIGGLQLGMDKAEFAKLFETAPQWKGEEATVSFSHQEKMSPEQREKMNIAEGAEDSFDVSTLVEGDFVGGKLAEFSIWKVSSY